MEPDQHSFPTDFELLANFSNKEDTFVERKLFSDTEDWLRTAVAFANTRPRGFYGVLFVGVKDDGSIQEQQNIESVQNKVAKKINEAYPQIFYNLKILPGLNAQIRKSSEEYRGEKNRDARAFLAELQRSRKPSRSKK